MKKIILYSSWLLVLTLISLKAWTSSCTKIYTIDAYDAAFKQHAIVKKLGPIPASQVPSAIPKSFLENGGSYGGGEVRCTISEACQLLSTQLASGLLANNENWHIYRLDGNWDNDTYQLHPNDYRIKHPMVVLELVKEKC